MQQLAPLVAPDGRDSTCDATFVVVKAGDAFSEIDLAVGFPIFRSLLDDLPFGDPDQTDCVNHSSSEARILHHPAEQSEAKTLAFLAQYTHMKIERLAEKLA